MQDNLDVAVAALIFGGISNSHVIELKAYLIGGDLCPLL